MWHKKKWCNDKDFAPQCEGEGIDFLLLQPIYLSLGYVI
jgi:hypothetical protein